MDLLSHMRFTGRLPPSWSLLSHFQTITPTVRHTSDDNSQSGMLMKSVYCMASSYPWGERLFVGRYGAFIDTMTYQPDGRYVTSHRMCIHEYGNRGWAPSLLAKMPYDASRVLCAINNEVMEIDVQQEALITRVHGHRLIVRCVDVIPNHPSIVASGGRDGVIAVWDFRCPVGSNALVAFHEPHAKERKQLRATKYAESFPSCVLPTEPRCTNLSPYYATESGTIFRRANPSKEPGVGVVRSTHGGVTGLCWLGDGGHYTLLLSACSTDGSLRLWDLRMMLPPRAGKATMPFDFFCPPALTVDAAYKTRGIMHMTTNRERSHVAVASKVGQCSVYAVHDLFALTNTNYELHPKVTLECIDGSYNMNCAFNERGDTLLVPQSEGFALQSIRDFTKPPELCFLGRTEEGGGGDSRYKNGNGEVVVWVDEGTVAVTGSRTDGDIAIVSLYA